MGIIFWYSILRKDLHVKPYPFIAAIFNILVICKYEEIELI